MLCVEEIRSTASNEEQQPIQSQIQTLANIQGFKNFKFKF